MTSDSSVFSFTVSALCVSSKKYLPTYKSQRFYFPHSFNFYIQFLALIFLGFMLMTVVRLKMCEVGVEVFFQADVQLFPHHLSKRLYFPPIC